MALPTKRSRMLTVDGRVYRWLTRRAFQGSDAGYVVVHRLILEPVEHPGSRLLAVFDSRALFPPSPGRKVADFLSITPRVVAAVVRYARSHGWAPEQADARARSFTVSDAGARFRQELSRAAEAAGEAKPGWRAWQDWG